nr:ATP-binding cassette sub-family A member 3-like [Onthophagus taurus]
MKMNSSIRQLRTMFWEHYKIRKRHFLLTLLEICLPIIIFLVVAIIRSKHSSFKKDYTPTRPPYETTDSELLTAINIVDTKLFYSPQTKFTSDLAREIQLKVNLYNEGVKGFDSYKDVIRYYKNSGDDEVVVYINFGDVEDEIPTRLKYDIQIYKEGVDWKTDKLFRYDLVYAPEAGSQQYLESEFLIFQWALDTCYLEMLTKSPLNISMSFQEFPHPPHWFDNGMNTMFVHILPLLTILSFIFLIPAVLRIVIIEKKAGMKQLMTINGLKSWVYWLGWFLNACIPCLISTVIISILLTKRLFTAEYAPLQYVSFLQLSLLIFLYCAATINFIFALSIFFKDAILAMITGISIWFLVYFVYSSIVGNVDIMPLKLKLLASLIPTIGLYNGFQVISVAEIRGSPVGFTEYPRASSDDMTMQMTFIMLLVDGILYLTITICFDSDHQGKYKISTFLSNCINLFRSRNNQDNLINMELEPIVSHEKGHEVVLEIKDITKTYGDIVALNRLNMQIYKDNLTVILGNNGAGKSTILSILTGLETQTSGKVTMKSMENINLQDRHLISVCPQEDMLFPELSVEEHLEFFGKLKGLPDKEIKNNVEVLLKELNLYDKRKANVLDLSSGTKRKLSIGIAILGKPKFIILDEPTASIDSNGRAEIWDIILKYKKDSIIILTTHLMIEAEVLADRVAILVDGSLQCYGTPALLKQKLKVSYQIQLFYTVKEQRKEIETFIRKYIEANIKPEIQINSNKYMMDFSTLTEEEAKIPSFLKLLDDRKKKFSINNYKIRLNMLEAVYLRCMEIYNAKIKADEHRQQAGDHMLSSLPNENKSNYWYKFKLIADKNLKIHRSMITSWTTMIILFYLFFVLTFTMNDSGYRNLSKDGKRLPLSLDSYGITKVYYETNCDGTKIERIFTSLVESTSSRAHKVENISKTVIDVGFNNIVEYKQKLIVGAKIICDETSKPLKIMVMYGNHPIHGAPISLNLITNVLVKYLTDENREIIASNTPLRSAKHGNQPKNVFLADYIISWVILLSNACLFSVVMFSALPTLETSSFIKTLSRIYKLNSLPYWFFNYVIDILLYLIIIIIPIMVLGIASTLNFVILQTSGYWNLVSILILYGITMIPHTYLYCFFQSSVSNAIAVLLILNMLNSVLVAMTFVLKEYFGLELFLYIFSIIDPHVVFTYTLSVFCQKMINNHNWDVKTPEQKEIICYDTPLPCCDPESVKCTEERAYIPYPLYLYISTVSAVIILFTIIIMDSGNTYWKNIFRKPEENVTFGAKGVQKSYKSGILGSIFKSAPIKVVKDQSFEVSKGECCGFIGVNGSGKTTSFKILTNQEQPDEGVIYKDKHSLIGYCPQQHSLLYSFTGKELLTYFGKLRNPFIDEKIIDELLEKCDLDKFKNKPCGTYSRGNKRKLNICIALIKDPDIIIVDEPTSGLDPESREKLMMFLMETKARLKSALLFTSHAMNEYELLCDKFLVMGVEGVKHDECYTANELKEMFNLGHIAQIKVKTGEPCDPILHALIELLVDVSKVTYKNYILTVSIKNSDLCSIIDALTKIKSERTDVTNFMVKESFLDGLFLEIMKGINK